MALKRIIVVGCGSIGRRHARLLSQRPHCQVELCEADAQVLSAASQEIAPAAAHTSFAAALATQPDVVVIATPHHLHAEQTIAALEAGAHVLCEKPMSDSVPAAQRMLDAAARSDRVLNIGFQLHFHPGLLRLKQLVESGELGAIAHLHCRVGSFITLRNSVSRYQASLEGALLLDYAHQPDAIHWLLGAVPRRVHMVGRQAGAMPLSSNPNVLSLTMEYEQALFATVHLNYMQMPERHEYELVGDRGWALFDLVAGTIRIGSLADEAVRCEPVAAERDPLYVAEHDAFFAACEGRRQPESSAADAIIAMRITEAAMTSWRSGQPVSMAG